MSRNLANRGSDLVVVQSATSTFQDSWAPAQHASLAAVRAVEIGRPVMQAALTGDSAVFDTRGRRLGILTTGQRGTLVVTIPLARGTTLFDRIGDWMPALSFSVLLLAAIAISVRRARMPSGDEPRPADDPRTPPESRLPTSRRAFLVARLEQLMGMPKTSL